jgi:hypothetical protein
MVAISAAPRAAVVVLPEFKAPFPPLPKAECPDLHTAKELGTPAPGVHRSSSFRSEPSYECGLSEKAMGHFWRALKIPLPTKPPKSTIGSAMFRISMLKLPLISTVSTNPTTAPTHQPEDLPLNCKRNPSPTRFKEPSGETGREMGDFCKKL